MSVRAKFKVVDHTVHKVGVTLNIQAVKGKEGENATFEAASPTGSGKIFVVDKALAAQFPPDSHIYFDLWPVDAEPPQGHYPFEDGVGPAMIDVPFFWQVAERNDVAWNLEGNGCVNYLFRHISEGAAAKLLGRPADAMAVEVFGAWGGSEIKLGVANKAASDQILGRQLYRAVVVLAPEA